MKERVGQWAQMANQRPSIIALIFEHFEDLEDPCNDRISIL